MNNLLFASLFVLATGVSMTVFTIIAKFDYSWLLILTLVLAGLVNLGLHLNSDTEYTQDPVSTMMVIGLLLATVNFVILAVDNKVTADTLKLLMEITNV